ncbi:MarR family transcriptional regulator [Nocardia sp. CDC159]|uniref:MarR family transcriptional regulator n=1 Tax=Nocardia pulmonis TaxID=2951408 RepID=A0A9X2IW63_9NOCA|nr:MULTISPECIES: MarR family transcriptional regulator [Nocardia]MCM6774622.1 MarR family transcriptional regulator [Nocardia pulmonis]MCM6787313.1 MarR family transcriptional regulator [Nocardia sp. CDC159]
MPDKPLPAESATDRPSAPRVPSRAEITEVIGFMPLIATFFEKARADMPAEHNESFLAHRLTSRHGAVCVQLVAEDSSSVGELAGRMGLALSTVSELVSDLDRAGWVTRQPDPANRRRTLVALQPKWREHMETFLARRAEPLLAAMATLTAEQRAGFAAGLRAWAHEIRNWRD